MDDCSTDGTLPITPPPPRSSVDYTLICRSVMSAVNGGGKSVHMLFEQGLVRLAMFDEAARSEAVKAVIMHVVQIRGSDCAGCSG